MAQLISHHGRCGIIEREANPFATLVGSIIGQQLSAKAAATIRLRILFIVSEFTPDAFLAASPEELRKAGLSAAKLRCITELSRRSTDGRIDFEAIGEKRNEEIITALIETPGIGRWTAEMFLIFGLKRPNIMSFGDAGLQRAARLLYGKDADLAVISESWSPYRSVASWYLWQHLDAP
jgi:DNA-3-methyladenine glycosylase II